jgi:lipid-binding SYLF domain-containing protein
MKSKWISVGLLAALALPAYAQEKEEGRIEDSGKVMQEILNAPDSIPQSVLDKAYCVAVPKGAFAGVSLEGSTLRPDNDANKKVYGKEIGAKNIVLEGAVKAPPSAATLISTLDKATPVRKT